jgi:hypothetical protein
MRVLLAVEEKKIRSALVDLLSVWKQSGSPLTGATCSWPRCSCEDSSSDLVLRGQGDDHGHTRTGLAPHPDRPT